jgi:methylase of polypeptide subunit release factors
MDLLERAGPLEELSDAVVGSRLLLTAELLCESVDLRAGQRVLDVACGSGNAALAAAEGFDVTFEQAVRRFDVSDDDTLVLRMDYLEAVISKPATP